MSGHRVTEEELRAVEEHKALAERCGVERVGDLDDGTGMLCSVPFAVLEELERLRSHPRMVPDIHTREQELIADGCDLADALDKCMRERDAERQRADAAEKSLKYSELGYQAMKDNLAQRDRRIAEFEAAMARALQPCDGCIDGNDKPCTCAEELKRVLRDAAPASPATATKCVCNVEFDCKLPHHAVRPSKTIFGCRVCDRSTWGLTDGRFDDDGWARIDNIDGPNAICPYCQEDDTVLDGLREEYPNASVNLDNHTKEPK